MKTPPQKAALVAEVERLLALGEGLRAACKVAGTSPASYGRWKQALEQAGGDPFTAFAPRKPTGRPPLIQFTREELDICRWHRLSKSSLDIAIYLAIQDERIRPEARQVLQEIHERALVSETRPSFPPSVRKAFEVSPEERARFRGKKATVNEEMVSARGMFYLDAHGQQHDILPGQLWEFDDYSANQPYSWLDPITGESQLGRQVLAALDVCLAGWIGFDHIGRSRDAYRGEDIVRFLERLFRLHGLPLFIRLERSVWESSFLHGLEVEGLRQPWGALDAIVHIEHVHKSKAKGTIEGSFSPLQTWLSHTGTDVGRVRGEFEDATKLWQKARKQGRDPRELGFLTSEESSQMHAEAARLMNARPRQREALQRRIAADDLRAELGWHTTPFPESEGWRFLPYREQRVVDAGMIHVNPTGGWPRMSFVVNGVTEHHLANGHRVLVAYDPARPDLGAYVANADRSARNREGWGMAQPLLTAPLYQRSAQIDLSGKYTTGAVAQRKKANAAVATNFRGIVGPGKAHAREALASDGSERTATAGDIARPDRFSPDAIPPDSPPRATPGREPAPLRPAARDSLAGDRLAALERAGREAADHL